VIKKGMGRRYIPCRRGM